MRLLLLAACLLCTTLIYAQPTNDDCANALNVPVSATGGCTNSVSSTTVGATNSGVAACVGSAEDDIWFKFTATGTTHVISFFHMFSSLTDPVIELMSGTCGSLTSIKCSQREVGTFNAIDIFTNLTPGVEYYVRVYDMNPSSGRSPVSLCVYEPLANDDCSGAQLVNINTDTSWTNYTQGNFRYSTASSTHCQGYFNSGDLWYKFVANDSVQLINHNVNNFSSGYSFQVLAGTCGTLTPLPLRDWVGTSSTCVSPRPQSTDAYEVRGLTAGNTYYIRVMYDSARFTGTAFNFALSNVPSNDERGGAINIPINSGSECVTRVQANNQNSTGPVATTSCGKNYWDMWFKFTALAARHLLAVKCNDTDDLLAFEIYSGTSLVSTGCAGGHRFGLNELQGLNVGAEYHIRILGSRRSSRSLNQAFELCITTPGLSVPNETCADAQTLSNDAANYLLGSTVGAVRDEQTADCSIPATSKDIWYKIIPPYNANITARVVSVPGYSVALGLFSGSCSSLTTVACNINNGVNSVSFSGAGGQTYYLRVGMTNTQSGPLVAYLSALSALPVTLTNFRISKITEKSIALTWQTTQESKIRAYYIQRSIDGVNFTDAGSVTAKNQANNDYSFTDNQPLSGRNYYRLKIVDVDDKVEYSKIIDARLKGSGDFSIYATQTTIRIVNEKNTAVRTSLTIYDAMGRLLSKQDIVLKPGINNLNKIQASGIVFIHLNTSEGSFVQRLY